MRRYPVGSSPANSAVREATPGILYRDEAVPADYLGYYAILQLEPRTVFRVQLPARLVNGDIWDRLTELVELLSNQEAQPPQLHLVKD